MVGLVRKPVITIYEGPYTEMLAGDGNLVSAIADEGLYGMLFGAAGEEEAGFVPVKLPISFQKQPFYREHCAPITKPQGKSL